MISCYSVPRGLAVGLLMFAFFNCKTDSFNIFIGRADHGHYLSGYYRDLACLGLAANCLYSLHMLSPLDKADAACLQCGVA